MRVLIWKITGCWSKLLTRNCLWWNGLMWDFHQFGVRQLVKHNERAMKKAGFRGFGLSPAGNKYQRTVEKTKSKFRGAG